MWYNTGIQSFDGAAGHRPNKQSILHNEMPFHRIDRRILGRSGRGGAVQAGRPSRGRSPRHRGGDERLHHSLAAARGVEECYDG